MRPSVYLAGPIRGLDYESATIWRDAARTALSDAGIDAFSPMRAKDYLRKETDVDGNKLKDQYADYPLSTMKAITTRDRNDCMGSSLVIMNLLGARTVSIGSILEVAWADAARVPVVLTMEKTGNLHDHGMIREMCGFQVETLDEAIECAKAILLP